MPRRSCGCGGENEQCHCRVVGDEASGVTVTGNGNEGSPFVVSAPNELQVADTDTVDMSVVGSGTPADPWIVSATAVCDCGDPIVDAGCGILVQGNTVSTNTPNFDDLDCPEDQYVPVVCGTDGALKVPPYPRVMTQDTGGRVWQNDYPDVRVDAQYLDDNRLQVFHIHPDDGGPDPLNNAFFTLAQVTNPDPCCPMSVTIDADFGNAPEFRFAENFCTPCLDDWAAAAGPNSAVHLDWNSFMQVNLDGAPVGVAATRAINIDIHTPGRIASDCPSGLGVRITQGGSGAGSNPDFSPVTLAPGATVDLDVRVITRMTMSNPGGARTLRNDAAMQNLVSCILAGARPYPFLDGAPGTDFGIVTGWSNINVFGVSDCG